MLRDRNITSGLRLITAGICLLLFVLPGFAFAETWGSNSSDPQVTTSIISEVTNQPSTTFPTVSPVQQNTSIAGPTPPLIVLDIPVIENLTCTIFGSVTPGSVNVTIDSIRWDWGDNITPEYHGFPYSHVYRDPGTYNLSITALQSDGQNITSAVNITVGQRGVPGTIPPTLNTSAIATSGIPGPVPGAPVLTLLEPVIDRTNVTLNGNLNPGSPGITIESVSIDWNDGNFTESADLPVTHQYSSPGIFTITILGKQSDRQTTTKRITLDLKEKNSVLPGPTASGPPSNNDPSVFPIILVTAIIVVVFGAMMQWIAQRRKRLLSVLETPKGFSPRTVPLTENLPSREELETICSGTDVITDVLDSVIRVAAEIAREGREGQAIGTSFVVGDIINVLDHSKQFVLNPFYGHKESERQITDVGIRGNIKEFAQLDGAFLIAGNGVVEAAGRCITVDMSKVNLPGGLGSRHSSVAGITQVTNSIGVVVSQSGGLISIFRAGKIVCTINSLRPQGFF
jgi:DNA integrity scanning protein DisA with diadenylate cyclase activity